MRACPHGTSFTYCTPSSDLNKTHVTEGMVSSLVAVARIAGNSDLPPDTLLVVEETAGSSGVPGAYLACYGRRAHFDTLSQEGAATTSQIASLRALLGFPVRWPARRLLMALPANSVVPAVLLTPAVINAVAYSGWQRVHRQDIVGWSFAFGKSHCASTC